MKVRAARAIWILIVAPTMPFTLSAGEVVAQEAPAGFQSFMNPSSPGDLRQGLEAMRGIVWRMRGTTGAGTPDREGRSFASDIDTLVLGKKATSEIENGIANSEEALARDPKVDIASKLLPPWSLLMVEFSRIYLLQKYWTFPEFRKVHMRYIDPLLLQESAEVRTAALKRLAEADSQAGEYRALAARIVSIEEMSSKTIQAVDAAIIGTYNDVRGELAAQHSPVEGGKVLDREAPCPAPVAALSANSRMAIKSKTDPSGFYPMDMQQQNLQGVVHVVISVSPTGCVSRARVRTSSGVPKLDEAALHVALAMEMHPGSEDGKTIDTEATMPVRFNARSAGWQVSR
jgi:TonB family protein